MAINSEVNISIRPEIKLVRYDMLYLCYLQVDEDPINDNVTILRTNFSTL